MSKKRKLTRVSNPRTILTGNDERETPAWLKDWAFEKFRISLDVAATEANKVGDEWLGPDRLDDRLKDGLAVDWADYLQSEYLHRVVWMNPPYSRGSLRQWCRKAAEQAEKGVTTVALLPADTSTRWYHAYCAGRPTFFIKGRVKFGPEFDKPAPFPSMIVLFMPEPNAICES